MDQFNQNPVEGFNQTPVEPMQPVNEAPTMIQEETPLINNVSQTQNELPQAQPPVQPYIEPQNTYYNPNMNTTPVQNFNTVAAQGAKIKLLPIILIIVGVILAGSILSYFFIPQVNNTINLLVMKPDKYTQHVQDKQFKALASDVSEAYAKALKTEENLGIEASIKAEISESFAAKMEIPAELKNAKLSIKSSLKGNKQFASIGVNVNDKDLATVNATVDLDETKAYLQVPELSDAYLMITEGIEELMSGYINVEGSDYSSILDEEVLDQETFEALLVKYFEIFNSYMTEVELEKNVEDDVAGIDYSYTEIIKEFTEADMYDLAEEILDEIKGDSDIKKILDEAGIILKDDYKHTIQSAIDSLKSEKDSLDKSELKETALEYTVYVNSKGEIAGMSFGVDGSELTVLTAQKGKEFAITAFSKEDKEETLSFEITGEKSGKSYSGNAKLKINDEYEPVNFDIDYEDYEIVDEDAGTINGKFTIKSDTTLENGKIVLDFSAEKKNQKIVFDYFENDEETVTVTLQYEQKDASDIKIPTENVYDVSNEDELNSYLESINVYEFVKKIDEALGTTLVSDMGITEESTATEIFNNLSGSGYEDDDWSHNDWSDDDWLDDGLDNSDSDSNSGAISSNSLMFKLDGKEIKFPFASADLIAKVDTEGVTSLSEYDYYSFRDADSNISLSVQSVEGQEQTPINECLITSIDILKDSGVNFYINDITFGSTREDVAATFGVEPNTEGTYYVTYYLDDGWNSITIWFDSNDTVDEIDIDIY